LYQADIVIVGAGVVGCAIARELSQYELKVLVVDKRDDVGGDASKSNSSIAITGFDCPPGSLEAALCHETRAQFDRVTRDLDVPFRVCGALMPAITPEQMERLPAIYEEAMANGVTDVVYLTPQEILEKEPEINPAVLGGLYIPREAVIDPFLYVVALAENAAANGVEFLLRAEVTGITTEDGAITAVETTAGTIQTKYVINAAGLFGDEVARMAGEDITYTVKPRKGQFFILDRNTPCKTEAVIYPIPTPTSRGKLLLQTVHGNMLLGPTAEDGEDKFDHSTTADGLAGIEADCKALVPNIRVADTITQYSGLRPNRTPAGFHIAFGEKTQGYFEVGGVRSTGVSCSLGIARYVADAFRAAGITLNKKDDYCPTRRGIVRFADADNIKRAQLMVDNPLYGRVICRCETVTEAEIVEAIHRKPGATTVDGVKRRLRAGMGRCQGGFCGPKVMEILSRELGIPMEQVEKNLPGSYLTIGPVRGGKEDASC